MIGTIKNKIEYCELLQKSLCVLTTSYPETFGCVFAEALHLGVPVIGDNSVKAGFQEIIKPEYLCNFNDHKKVINIIDTIRENIVKLDDGTPAANYKIAEYPSSHAAFSNKDVCIKAIRMERKLELAMEGERWFDLSRWGGDVMASELKAYVDYEKQYISKFAGASYLPANKTMLPVPDDEILTLGTDPETGTPYLVQPEAWRN